MFVTIVIDGGIYTDPAVFGPYDSKWAARVDAQAQGAVPDEDYDPARHESSYIICEVSKPEPRLPLGHIRPPRRI